MKEFPQYNSIPSQTHRIPQYQLRAHPPPKEPKVARMPQHRIHPMTNEHVAVLPLHLHRVVEVAARLRHRDRPHHLPQHHQRNPDHHLHLDAADRTRPREVAARRPEPPAQETLRDGGQVRSVVGPAVGREQECGHRCVAGVVRRCYVVLEEVEDAQRGEEERDAPEGCGGEEDEDQGEGDGEAEGCAD